MKLLNIIEDSNHFWYILVVGGSGSGKNHWVNRYLPNMSLVDVDKIRAENEELSINNSIEFANCKVLHHLYLRESVVQVSVGRRTTPIVNKMLKAQSLGAKTALIHIDVSIDTALDRVYDRTFYERISGARRVQPPEFKVIQSNHDARNVYESLKNEPFIDYSERVNYA